MKKTLSEIEKAQNWMKQIKQLLDFDDSSIRMLLGHSYPELLEQGTDWFMEEPLEYKIVSFAPSETDKNYSDLGQFSSRPDLKVFWNIHVQKQVLYFEEECLLLMNISKARIS